LRRLSSTRNFRVSFSYTLSLSFGSSRANPKEGPAQPPCIRATRRAESILFCSIYSLSFTTAKSVTLKSDMLPPRINDLLVSLNCFGLNFYVEVVSVPTQNKVLLQISQSMSARNSNGCRTNLMRHLFYTSAEPFSQPCFYLRR
jgi:hypothetical protein